MISKSLLDTTAVVTADGAQQMGNLNAILAFQIAHILLAHRLDTKFAFNDRMLFPTNAVFNRIPMHHTDADATSQRPRKPSNYSAPRNSSTDSSTSASTSSSFQQRVKALKALERAA